MAGAVDGIQSAKDQPPAAAEGSFEKDSELSYDMDDDERARKIAEQDLNQKKKQTYSGFLLLWLGFQSTGTIHGDIGTSPLYVYSSTFTAQPSWDDLVGALSIIIWALTLIVTLKYCFIVLRADDDGQGGTFALYSLLARYAHITRRDPNTPVSRNEVPDAASPTCPKSVDTPGISPSRATSGPGGNKD